MKSKYQATRRHNRTLLACALASCMLLAAPAGVRAVHRRDACAARSWLTRPPRPAPTVTATNVATGLVRTRAEQSSDGNYRWPACRPARTTGCAANGQSAPRPSRCGRRRPRR